jgi:hypothetical protein
MAAAICSSAIPLIAGLALHALYCQALAWWRWHKRLRVIRKAIREGKI